MSDHQGKLRQMINIRVFDAVDPIARVYASIGCFRARLGM